MKLDCYIVRDLLGNYIENLVCEETASDIREHLECCESCRTLHDSMVQPIPREAICSNTDRDENVRNISYLGKFRKIYKGMTLALTALGLLAALAIGYILSTTCTGLFFGSLLLPKYTQITDIAQYETLLGESGKYKDNYICYNDIFPDAIPESAKVSVFNSTYSTGFDDCYLSYLVYTCPEADFADERERLAGIDSSADYSVYGTSGFGADYELCAVYADEYYGMIYALANPEDNELVYVALEFCNFICDIDYESIINSAHLPIGFDASEGNATRAAFDAEYSF